MKVIVRDITLKEKIAIKIIVVPFKSGDSLYVLEPFSDF